MAINKRRKMGPRAPPPPVAAVKGENGTFTHLQGERELFVCDMNMVVSMTWSWGVGETFEAGTCPARLAQFVGDKADKHAKWRPEAVLIVGFDGNSLMKVPGYVNVLSSTTPYTLGLGQAAPGAREQLRRVPGLEPGPEVHD